jgi:hypothetical protein
VRKLFLILLPLLLISLLPVNAAETNQTYVTANVQELLETVSPPELGFDNLSTEKMRAELTGKFISTTKMDVSGLTSLFNTMGNLSVKSVFNATLQKLKSGEAATLAVDHKVEVFSISSIYSNAGTTTSRARMTLKVVADQDISGLKIFEVIPKSAVSSSAQIILAFSSGSPSIVESDPVLEWDIESLRRGESKTFIYYLNGSVANDSFRTLAVYETPKPQVQQANVTATPAQQPQANATEPKKEEPVQPGVNQSQAQPIEKQPGAKRNPWFFIAPILVVSLIAGSGYGLAYLKRKKEEEHEILLEQKLQPHVSPELKIRPNISVPYDKVRTVERFIENRIRQGSTDSQIKQELLDSGWDSLTLDAIMHDVHVVDNNISKLDKFAQTCIDKGMSFEEIRSTLVRAGWRVDLVDLVLDYFKYTK